MEYGDSTYKRKTKVHRKWNMKLAAMGMSLLEVRKKKTCFKGETNGWYKTWKPMRLHLQEINLRTRDLNEKKTEGGTLNFRLRPGNGRILDLSTFLAKLHPNGRLLLNDRKRVMKHYS